MLDRDSRCECSTDGRVGGSSGTASSIVLSRSRLLSCTRESVMTGGMGALLGTGADAERTVKGGGSRAGICGTVHCLSKLILESRCSRSDLSRSKAATFTIDRARNGSGEVMTSGEVIRGSSGRGGDLGGFGSGDDMELREGAGREGDGGEGDLEGIISGFAIIRLPIRKDASSGRGEPGGIDEVSINGENALGVGM